MLKILGRLSPLATPVWPSHLMVAFHDSFAVKCYFNYGACTLGGSQREPGWNCCFADNGAAQLLATATALSAPLVFGDERDAIMTKWNQIQAFWGTGRGYYRKDGTHIDFTPQNHFCRFKVTRSLALVLGLLHKRCCAVLWKEFVVCFRLFFPSFFHKKEELFVSFFRKLDRGQQRSDFFR